MQCEEWADANSELFKEAHDETVRKNSYKRKLYELISASLTFGNTGKHRQCHKVTMKWPISISSALLATCRNRFSASSYTS